jgi:crotonobetainyl-CoA:carnitine CoA-transferase CaiB-like acyl-CoA transferase
MMIDIFRGLLSNLDRPEPAEKDITITNKSAVSATSYHLDDIMLAVQMANGTLLNDIWALKTGRRQKITIDYIHAALAYLSFFLVFQNGNPIRFPDRHRIWPYYPIMDAYKTADDRHVYITGVYPALRDGLLDLLNCPNNATAIGDSIRLWKAEDLEHVRPPRALGFL